MSLHPEDVGYNARLFGRTEEYKIFLHSRSRLTLFYNGWAQAEEFIRKQDEVFDVYASRTFILDGKEIYVEWGTYGPPDNGATAIRMTVNGLMSPVERAGEIPLVFQDFAIFSEYFEGLLPTNVPVRLSEARELV